MKLLNRLASLFKREPIPVYHKPTVYYFHATWCAPCKKMADIIDSGDINATICKIDIDEQPDFKEYWKIHSIPTFILLEPGFGYEVDRTWGVHTAKQLNEWIKYNAL